MLTRITTKSAMLIACAALLGTPLQSHAGPAATVDRPVLAGDGFVYREARVVPNTPAQERIWLFPNETPACERVDDVCADGETPATCPADCGYTEMHLPSITRYGDTVLVWQARSRHLSPASNNSFDILIKEPSCWNAECVHRIPSSLDVRHETRPTVWGPWVAYETDLNGIEVANWQTGQVIWNSESPDDRTPHLWNGRLAYIGEATETIPDKCGIGNGTEPRPRFISIDEMLAGSPSHFLGQERADGTVQPPNCPAGQNLCCTCETVYASTPPYCDGCFNWKFPRLGGPDGRWMIYHGDDCGPQNPATGITCDDATQEKLYLTDVELGCSWRISAPPYAERNDGLSYQPASWDIFDNVIVWSQLNAQGVRDVFFLELDPAQLQRDPDGYCPVGHTELTEACPDSVPMVPILNGTRWQRGQAEVDASLTSHPYWWSPPQADQYYPAVWKGLGTNAEASAYGPMVRASSVAVLNGGSPADIWNWDEWNSGNHTSFRHLETKLNEFVHTDVHGRDIAVAEREFIQIIRVAEDPVARMPVDANTGEPIDDVTVTHLAADGDVIAYLAHPNGFPSTYSEIRAQDIRLGASYLVAGPGQERRFLDVGGGGDGILDVDHRAYVWQERDPVYGAWRVMLDHLGERYVVAVGEQPTVSGHHIAWVVQESGALCTQPEVWMTTFLAEAPEGPMVLGQPQFVAPGSYPHCDAPDGSSDEWLVAQSKDPWDIVWVLEPGRTSPELVLESVDLGCSGLARPKVSALSGTSAIILARAICGGSGDRLVAVRWEVGTGATEVLQIAALPADDDDEPTSYDIRGTTVIFSDGEGIQEIDLAP